MFRIWQRRGYPVGDDAEPDPAVGPYRVTNGGVGPDREPLAGAKHATSSPSTSAMLTTARTAGNIVSSSAIPAGKCMRWHSSMR
jgi:hypothetical protein